MQKKSCLLNYCFTAVNIAIKAKKLIISIVTLAGITLDGTNMELLWQICVFFFWLFNWKDLQLFAMLAILVANNSSRLFCNFVVQYWGKQLAKCRSNISLIVFGFWILNSHDWHLFLLFASISSLLCCSSNLQSVIEFTNFQITC